MSSVILPPDEPERLRAIRRYEILDTPPDGAFDRVAALAARLFDVPIATVTIVDHDRIWFKARHGVDVDETGRDPGLCASAILQPGPYVVRDARADPRALDNPLVRGELGLRFYAAAPIRTRDGHNLGTVNVIDRRPRQVSDDELATLVDLADIVADELELRLAARRAVHAERSARRDLERLAGTLQQRLLPSAMPAIGGLDVATHYRPASPTLSAGGDFFDVFELGPDTWGLAVGDVCGKGSEAAVVMGQVRHSLRALARVEASPGAVLANLNEVLLHEDLGERFCTVCYGRVWREPGGFAVRLSSAGHPLPLVRRADGTVEQVGQAGQVLGPLPAPGFTDEVVRLGGGDVLLLYTDGAIEQRGVPVGVGERALRAMLRSAPASDANAILERLQRQLETALPSIDDDVALLLAQATGS